MAVPEIIQAVTAVLVSVLVVVLCLAGIGLSSLSLSGTWLVVLAAVLKAATGKGFPGWTTVALFALVSLVIEGIETVAGFRGVVRRGGSAWAGAGALLGGTAGLVLASPAVPVVGSLIGLAAGSFLGAFAVEVIRLRRGGAAARIAWGAVLARILMVAVKTGASLGMTATLFAGMILR